MPARKSLYGTTAPTMPDLPLERVAALQTASQVSVQQLPIDAIEPNPYQARVSFDNLEDLAAAIRAQGFTSRLRVRPHPAEAGRFQLVYGERRLRAARLAGLTMIPCEIVPHTDAEMIEIGLAENIQREELRPMEEARALGRFVDERGYSIRELAERIGKTKGWVQTRLDLLRMPDDVQQMVDQHPETFTTGLIIGQLPSQAEREPLITSMVAGTTTKDEVRRLVQQLNTARTLPAPVPYPQVPSAVEAGSADENPHAAALPANATPATQAPPQRTPARRRSAETPSADARRQRQSERALRQSKQSFEAMLAQARGLSADLLPEDRNALLAFIVDEHFPELERFVAQLRDNG